MVISYTKGKYLEFLLLLLFFFLILSNSSLNFQIFEAINSSQNKRNLGTKISVHPAFLIFFFYIVIIFSNSVLNFVQTKKMKSTSYPFLSRFYSKPLFFLQISPISLREKKICQDRAISSNDISMRIFNQLQFI